MPCRTIIVEDNPSLESVKEQFINGVRIGNMHAANDDLWNVVALTYYWELSDDAKHPTCINNRELAQIAYLLASEVKELREKIEAISGQNDGKVALKLANGAEVQVKGTK